MADMQSTKRCSTSELLDEQHYMHSLTGSSRACQVFLMPGTRAAAAMSAPKADRAP